MSDEGNAAGLRCAFEGCEEMVDPSLLNAIGMVRFACKRHWLCLSESQKQTIVAAYRDHFEGRIGAAELRRIQRGVLDVAQAPLFRRRK